MYLVELVVETAYFFWAVGHNRGINSDQGTISTLDKWKPQRDTSLTGLESEEVIVLRLFLTPKPTLDSLLFVEGFP